MNEFFHEFGLLLLWKVFEVPQLRKADKITILIEIPIIQWFILKIYSCRFGTLEVSKSLTPNILVVFGDIYDLGVKWQRSICLGDQADKG